MAESVDLIISTKTEKLCSIHKQKNAVFISKVLTNKEAAIENEFLKKRRELIDQGQNKKDFSVRDAKLYKRDRNQ